MKLTKFQWVTLIAIVGYLVWEFYFVARWARELPPSDPIIRADLVFIYPILAILIGISIYQFTKKKR